MNRMHVHLSVADIASSVGFYSRLFGMEPTVRKPDYAKWHLDDPRVHFAISARGRRTGLDHLGIQVESDDDLAAVRGRFEAADAQSTVAETGVSCCYAKSDKHWVTDPQGIPWEAFHSLGTVEFYDGDEAAAAASGCCAADAAAQPVAATAAGCCGPGANAMQGPKTAARSCC